MCCIYRVVKLEKPDWISIDEALKKIESMRKQTLKEHEQWAKQHPKRKSKQNAEWFGYADKTKGAFEYEVEDWSNFKWPEYSQNKQTSTDNPSAGTSKMTQKQMEATGKPVEATASITSTQFNPSTDVQTPPATRANF